MKKVILIAALAAAIVAGCCLTACTAIPAGTGSGSISAAESAYGFSAVSAGMIISSMTEEENTAQPGADGATASGESTSGGEETQPGTDEPAPETSDPAPETPDGGTTLDDYMSLVDGLLSGGAFGVVTQPSDRPEYSDKDVVTYTSGTGAVQSYEMYYNLTGNYGDDDDDDDEEEYGIDGIMIVDGAEYPVRGERSVERDGGETESETEFRVTLGERYYMSVEHSSETEDENGESSVQQEYSYSIYRDGRLVERSTVEYETENERGDSETEVKMTAYADGVSSVFCFTKETVRGEEIIRLRAGEGRDVRNYIVRVIVNEDGSTDYVYEEYGGR